MPTNSNLFFEGLPEVILNHILNFLDYESLRQVVASNKFLSNASRPFLQLEGIKKAGFFKKGAPSLFHIKEPANVKAMNALYSALSILYTHETGGTKKLFNILDENANHPFIHQHFACFILRERWQYQRKSVLVKALEIAEKGAAKNNLECCILLASLFAKGLILQGKETQTVLIDKNVEKAKKYLITTIDLTLGAAKGNEYAAELGEKLLALVGQGGSQVIKILSLNELQNMDAEMLSMLAFSSNLIDFFKFSSKEEFLKFTMLPSSLKTWRNACGENEETFFMLATLLLENPSYQLEYDWENGILLKLGRVGSESEYYSHYYLYRQGIADLFQYQQRLMFHFSLGLEISEKLFFTNFSFNQFDSEGKAIIPPQLAPLLIRATQSIEKMQERCSLISEFSKKYGELTSASENVNAEFDALPILSNPQITLEHKKLIKTQIYWHFTELAQLKQNEEVNEDDSIPQFN